MAVTTLALAGCSDSGSSDGGDGSDGEDGGDGDGSDGSDGSSGDGGTDGTTAAAGTDGGGDGDGNGGSGTATATADTGSDATATPTCATASGDPTGEVTENVVSGIEVTQFSAQRSSDSFVVSVTLENVGDQTTTMEYNIDVTTYDADGTQLNEGFTTIQRSYGSDYEPGESQTFEVEPQLDCPSAVARYEIEVNCAATPNSGDYCE